MQRVQTDEIDKTNGINQIDDKRMSLLENPFLRESL